MMPRNSVAFCVRPMTMQDLDAVSSFEAHVPDGWSKQDIAATLSSPAMRCFVACAGSVPIAFAAVTMCAGQADLHALSTHPGWRRRGAARALLTHLLNTLAAAAVTDIFLEVRASNIAAQALYRSMGFQAVGTRRSFYSHPCEDALLMRQGLL